MEEFGNKEKSDQLQMFSQETMNEALELLKDAKQNCGMFLRIDIDKFIEKHAKAKNKLADRRYYLHRVLKKKYKVDASKRTIDVPYATFKEIPDGDRYYIGRLIAMGYNVQLKLI